jgi:hypothetical protein
MLTYGIYLRGTPIRVSELDYSLLDQQAAMINMSPHDETQAHTAYPGTATLSSVTGCLEKSGFS